MYLDPNCLCKVDCLDLLERVDSSVANLVYLDPPWFSMSSEEDFVPSGIEGRDKKAKRPSYEQAKASQDEEFSYYLNWLSKVIQQAKRVTSEKGSVVIHTEPRINSYARVIAERIFGPSFVTEIILRKPRITVYGRNVPRDEHENLLLCQLSSGSTYNPPFRPLTSHEMASRYNREDSRGRFLLTDITTKSFRSSLMYEWRGVTPPRGRSWRFSRDEMERLDSEGRIHLSAGKHLYLKSYADESVGVPTGNIWDDLPVRVSGEESTDFAAQQPVSMLERVIATTTNENDLIVDPFCGSGTSLVAAQLSSRRWIGCDNSTEAIEITKERLAREAGAEEDKIYRLIQEKSLKDQAPVLNSYSQFATGLIDRTVIRFVRNRQVDIEETRYYEFKEVKGNNPVSSIVNAADEYAVAFLNCEGGRVLWGIRNEDRVTVGVPLNYRQRDDVAKAVDNKLFQVQPQLGPSAWCLEFHQVYESRTAVNDLFVVELVVSMPSGSTLLYATGKGEVFMKTDSGKKRLSFTEVQAELINRLNANPRRD